MGTVLEDSTSYTITTVPGGEPLGMENGTIPDENITASSSASAAPPHLGRLNGPASWCTGKADGCYLQVDLGSLHLLCAVATQGNPGGNRDYVKRYKLLYSTDSSNWTTYEENGNNIIAGNKDNASVQRKDLEQELIIRYVRFCPVDWYCWPCMRVELYGAPLNIGEKIGHLGSDEGGGFVIDKVMVTTYETQVDENGEPGLNEEANASKKTTEGEGHDYMVHIYTGNKWGAGTDANVMITIFGKEGDSGERKLDNEKNNFETGQKDSFPVNCTGSLGRLTKIRIGHDNTGFGAAWFLDKVIVEDLKSGETVEFPCQRWFSTNDDDGQITRELTRADGNDAEMTDHDYLVHIYTGDKWGAGTDANVMITIFGEDGDSGERRLDNNKNNFETGQKDSFTLTCATSLGRLTKVRIGHDNTGFGAAWFLDKVAVEDPKTGETVEFPCQRWFSIRDDDGQITRELIRADVLVVDDGKTSPVTGHDYIAHIYTGDKWGAGTDANVMITIFGEEGDSGQRRLDNDSNNFENGQKDSFTVSCATSLGRLTKIKIGHDNTGFGAAWFLDKVVIEDSKTGETAEFPCQRWFATSEDDGKIIRDLIRPGEEVKDDERTAVPGQQTVVLKIRDVGQVEPQPDQDGSSGKEQENVPTDITYEKEEVVVKTDEIQIKPAPKQEEPTVTEQENLPQEIVIDKEEVLVKTDEIKIESPPEQEEPKVKEEENLPPVIIINKEEVVVKTDEIQIEAPPEKEEPTAVKEEENLPQEIIIDKGHDYLVHIYTGDKWGAGTDANVMITIFGEDGDSGERKLDNNKNNFETGQKDSFTLSCATHLGRLNKIRIGHDNTGFGAAWFLDKVTVEDPKTGETVEFPCQRWFSTSEDDGQITRELTRTEKVLEPTEEAQVEMQPDKDEPSEEAQESIPEEVTIEKEVILVIKDETQVESPPEQEELTVKEQEHLPQEIIVDKGHDYLVHIYTGDKWGAGTDANVMITIFGEDGDSGERKLDNNKNNFETGQKDSFTLTCATHLGRLNKIRIGHDNTGFGAAWFLDKVTVEDPKTGETVEFPCQRWFSTSEDDGQITRELTRTEKVLEPTEEAQVEMQPDKDEPSEEAQESIPEEVTIEKEVILVIKDETQVESPPEQEEPTVKEQEHLPKEIIVDKGHDYLVHIYTGDKWGAGTDANVMITIFGEDGDSGERKLDNNKNNFETGQKDSFTLTCATHLGRLNKIRIGHDNTGFGAAWFLDKVTVEDSKTGETVEFPCQRWFSTSEDDGQITRELFTTDDDSVRSSVSDTSYSEPNVFIKTSPEPIVRKEEKSPYPDEKDSSQISQTTRVISVSTTITRTRHQDSRDRLHRCESEPSFVKEVSIPYRSQPRCDHLLPADPAVQMAEEMSFFDKYQENEGKLRPFPSWYGSLDMGSLPHLYSPTNPITDEDIDKLLAIEAEDFEKWKRVKKSRELEIYSRKGTGRGSPPVYKAIMILKDVPYRDAIDLLSDWDERGKWDKTFDGVSFLDQMGDFKVLKCSHNKKNRCLVLASLDREDEEPYYAWAWKSANHPSVPGEDTKLTVMRLDTGICGAIIRPYHDATQSSKITLITQVRGSVPSSLKSTYLIGNPSKWLIWLKKHHDSQVNKTAEQNKENDDSSSV
ncbi:lipoxygenase homology domain-containing protein 1-like isoform X3 [Porites lutea]|uniref:lipoxygenase homology domain-containing protein 1-like isoform X3 n=1 Tax=Porites lutea TaxID=51062 RepID=UPI003CC58619